MSTNYSEIQLEYESLVKLMAHYLHLHPAMTNKQNIHDTFADNMAIENKYSMKYGRISYKNCLALFSIKTF